MSMYGNTGQISSTSAQDNNYSTEKNTSGRITHILLLW